MEKASLPDRTACAFCGHSVEGPLAPHLCPRCGRAQPLCRDEDYFVALGLPRRFGLDPDALETRFYELSRALHPDRLEGGLERMSLINQAYTTLRNPEKRRQYLLRLEGVDVLGPESASRQIPVELAESWFELQEKAMEDEGEFTRLVLEFEKALRERMASEEVAIRQLEDRYDGGGSGDERASAVRELGNHVRTGQYLKSLERQLKRMTGPRRGPGGPAQGQWSE